MSNIEILKQNGIDVDHGIELLGDIEMYNSIMEEYYNNSQNRIKQLEYYKTSGDLANYAIEVHSLKSDSRYLGMMNLGDLAYELELAAKALDINKISLKHDGMIKELNRMIDVILVYFGNSSEEIKAPSIDPNTTMITKEQITQSSQAILVADDSSIIRDFVKEIFNNQYAVLMAGNGKEVINIIESNPNIIAVLLDLNMPNVDGFQVLEYFKTNDLFEKIPVSIISGANDKESIDKAFTYPIVDMLNKPFNKEDVKLVVEKTINIKNV